jgi:hypothetical protein
MRHVVAFVLVVIPIVAMGCGGAADTGEGWSFAGDDGTRVPASEFEADEILFVRREGGQTLGTTRIEGAGVEFGAEYEKRTFQWPEGVDPVPVEGLGDIEGRKLMRVSSGYYDIDSQLSVGVVSGRVHSTADGLEIRSPEFQLCQTARLLDYTLVPREGDRCAHVEGRPVQVTSRELTLERVVKTIEGRKKAAGSYHLAVTFGDASRWSTCSIDLLYRKPNLDPAPTGPTDNSFRRFLSTFGRGYTKTSIDCRGASSLVEVKRRESWMSGKLNVGSIDEIAGMHLQTTLEGRDVALWLRVDPSVEVTDSSLGED